MSIRKRQRKRPSATYINVAPFVDVMLVLMMIFMLTTQIPTGGIPVNLPKTTTTTKTNEEEAPIIITVDKDSNIYIAEAPITLEDLLKKLPKIVESAKSDTIYIKGDQNLNYGKLIEIMGIISSAGVCKVALIAESRN